MVTFWVKYDTGHSHWMRLVSEKKLHTIKQRSGIHPVILSEAKLAYPTAWAMGEEGKVVSFPKGFTNRAFAGPGEGGLVMDEEPMDVDAAQTNQESVDGFLPILETGQRLMGQLQACMDKQ